MSGTARKLAVAASDDGDRFDHDRLKRTVAHGGELYRDAPVYPLPGAFYLLAWAFRLAGTSVLVARQITLVEFTLFAVCLFLVLRRLVPPVMAAVGVGALLLYRIWVFPHWQMYSYSTTALLCLAGGLVALGRFLETGDRRALCLAGLGAGLAGVTKQDYGAAGLAALNVALLAYAATRPRNGAATRRGLLACLNGPPLALGALVGLHFWRQGLLGEMLRQTVWGHLGGIMRFEYPTLPALWPFLRQDPHLRDGYAHVVWTPPILYTVDWEHVRASWLYADTAVWDVGLKLFFYAPYALIAVSVVRLWRMRGALGDPARAPQVLHEIALSALGAALWLSLNRPRDYVHVAVLYWPFILLLVVYAHRLARGSRWRTAAVTALALILAVVTVPYSARLAARLRTEHPIPVGGPRGGIRVKPAEAKVLDGVVQYVRSHTRPADTVAVLPYFPLVSFLADRRGPHPASYVVWPVKPYPDRDQRILDAMEAAATPLVVYSLTQWVQFPRFQRYAPELFTYLTERYELVEVFSPDAWGYVFAVLRRRTAPPSGEPLAVSEGDVSIEAPGGLPAHPLDGAERAAFVATARWPFTEVVALRPSLAGRRTVLRVPLEVPAHARLETAVGVNPDRWVAYPASWVEFAVGIDGEPVFTQRLDPARNVTDRRWVDATIPLARWAGRTITLELSTTCERAEGESLEMAGFAVPRLVER